jgi:NitT/TauT family transport system substrate-binding protein
MLDPKNAAEIIKMAKDQTTGFSDKVLWKSLYGTYPATVGGTPDRNIMYYTISPEANELITRAAAFLYEIKSINTPKIRPEAVMPEFTQAILKERNLKTPLGIVKAQPDSAFRK